MNTFSILITTPPFDNSLGNCALAFVRQACQAQQKIDHVFFYGPGVYHANALTHPPSDEFHPRREWEMLHAELGIRLIVCVTAATRRGIIGSDVAQQEAKNVTNLTLPFEQAGLGEFFTALHNCNQLVQF